MQPSAIMLDNDRTARVGLDEAVLCEQKTPDQIAQIIGMSLADGRRRLFTRLAPAKFAALPPALKTELHYRAGARTAFVGPAIAAATAISVAIVSGGSSDAPVVEEAHETLRYYGQDSLVVADVGVAGLWRLLARVEEIGRMPVVIAVAGMDAALPTVLAGLVPSAIIGVPCSTGYGVAQGGVSALTAMLASCAPGLTVTNVDNGYGAACAAMRILNAAASAYPGNSVSSPSESA